MSNGRQSVYTEEFRCGAGRYVRETGYSTSDVARRLGIGVRTLHS